MLIGVDFTLNLVARATRSSTVGAATLDHKVGNDAVEIESIVEAVFGKFDKVGNRIRSIIVKKIDIDGPLFGFHNCFSHTDVLE